MFLKEIRFSVLDIKEEDIVYANPNAHLPIRAVKLFLPQKTNMLFRKVSALLSKTHIATERKNYAAKQNITAYTTIEHGRSASIPLRFKDKYGNIYNWINFKGIGVTYWGRGGFRKGATNNGILEWGNAHRDRLFSDHLLKIGVRTHVVLYLIKLRQIPGTDGELHPIEEIVPDSLKAREQIPVVAVRGMRNFLRIKDLEHMHGREKERTVNNAIEVVKREAPEVTNRSKYLRWFASTLANQLSIMYSFKIYHGLLTSHNITLAAEIVDLDSMKSHNLIKEDDVASSLDLSTDVARAYPQLSSLAKSLSLDKEQGNEAVFLFLRKCLGFVADRTLGTKADAYFKGELQKACGKISTTSLDNGIMLVNILYGAMHEGYAEAKETVRRCIKFES